MSVCNERNKLGLRRWTHSDNLFHTHLSPIISDSLGFEQYVTEHRIGGPHVHDECLLTLKDRSHLADEVGCASDPRQADTDHRTNGASMGDAEVGSLGRDVVNCVVLERCVNEEEPSLPEEGMMQAFATRAVCEPTEWSRHELIRSGSNYATG